MKRYEVDYALTYDGTVYNIFDNYIQDYLTKEYDDFDLVTEDCDLMNYHEEIENSREFG